MKLKNWHWLLIGIIGINLLIVITGHSYLYTTVNNTILKGRLGPEIFEYTIFDNREIAVGEPKPFPHSENFGHLVLTPEEEAEIEALEPVALLMLRNDSILFERYWEGYTFESWSNSFSAAKSLVNVAIGAAIEQGYIKSLDQPVSDFIPDFDFGVYPELSIRHLLQMSSGINFDENYLNPFAFPAKANYGTDLKALVGQYSVDRKPGQKFEYRSGNTQMLAFIIEKATGMKLGEFFSKSVWQKVGAEHPALWSLDVKDGDEKAFCCFNSNARDFARIGLLYLHGGELYGNRIVSEDFVRESVRNQNLKEVDGSFSKRYGLHWWRDRANGKSVYYARGILGQYIFVVPEDNMVIVRLGHKRIKPEGIKPPEDIYLYLNIADRFVEILED